MKSLREPRWKKNCSFHFTARALLVFFAAAFFFLRTTGTTENWADNGLRIGSVSRPYSGFFLKTLDPLFDVFKTRIWKHQGERTYFPSCGSYVQAPPVRSDHGMVEIRNSIEFISALEETTVSEVPVSRLRSDSPVSKCRRTSRAFSPGPPWMAVYALAIHSGSSRKSGSEISSRIALLIPIGKKLILFSSRNVREYAVWMHHPVEASFFSGCLCIHKFDERSEIPSFALRHMHGGGIFFHDLEGDVGVLPETTIFKINWGQLRLTCKKTYRKNRPVILFRKE